MKSIKGLVMKETRPVYVHTPSKALAKDFLKQVEQEGFLFADGKQPTKKSLDDCYALHQDLTINYIGFVGRLRFNSNDDGILRVEYQDLFKE